MCPETGAAGTLTSGHMDWCGCGVVVVVCAEDEAKPMQAMGGLFRGIWLSHVPGARIGLGVVVVSVRILSGVGAGVTHGQTRPASDNDTNMPVVWMAVMPVSRRVAICRYRGRMNWWRV